jgi:hypothetical protein
LKGWLDAGLSLPQIGALTDRDPSTVGYWVQKHGLTANGRDKYAPRGGLTREQLERLVEANKTVAEIAAALDCSESTVRHWLKRHGLKANGRRGPEPRVPRREVDLALENGKRTVVARCPYHGETVFVIEKSGRARCGRCRMNGVAEWRRRAKARLVAEAGGECQLCGYDRCRAALVFHHLDPSAKSFSLSLRGITRSFEKMRAEAAKCALLCANCHAEVEAGYSSL